MKKRKLKKEEAQVNPELKGLDIHVNEFGEIISNISVDKLNDFLDRNVVDKKLDEDEWKEKKNAPSTGIRKKRKTEK
ncbi:MAG: hypothetical protein H0W62_01700 [Chitinophagales bacterium]|nr:hypothetical protein [Chitinophagales bacterium]